MDSPASSNRSFMHPLTLWNWNQLTSRAPPDVVLIIRCHGVLAPNKDGEYATAMAQKNKYEG